MARYKLFKIIFIFLTIESLFKSTSALSRDNLYPYMDNNFQTLPTDSNGQLSSVQVELKTPIAFYDKIYNNIFVNGNGVLSFIRSMQRFFNIAFPLDDPVIAPLYTHVDTKGSGKIFYGETNNPEILSRASGMVRAAFKNITDFMPTHVFLTTWVDVGYFNEKHDKVNTYQVAIASNGTHSFAELLYPNDGIQWIQGESHPNGLPDARAQAGFMSEGRMYTLKGSGTDQIQNIDKWSNINRPGQWIFQIGPIADGKNIKVPDNIETFTNLFTGSNEPTDQTCMTGATTCHSKATCIDYEYGYCCNCKPGYFGNGKFCQPNDLPLRVIGRISGKINGEEFSARDLQCYVQTKDGRTYTALSRIPDNIGHNMQLLSTLGGIIGWLFAKPIGKIKNGYQLTGGLFNHTAELVFSNTGDRVLIKSIYLGLDVFGQLKMEADIQGTLPNLPNEAKVDYGDHDELYTRSQRGSIRSHSNRVYRLNGDKTEYPFTLDQSIMYHDCPYDPEQQSDETTRLKFSRGLTTYESREGILRFAMNTKITPLEEEDPCIRGRETCSQHSSCVVDADDFRCVCNSGYQQLYQQDGSSSCVDINECTAGYHVCSSDAQCINNEGGHTCQCRPGFSGDGRICEKLATCEDTRCGDYEQCTVVNGIPTCSCVTGFINDRPGLPCYPANDPCNLANNCSPQGMCTYDTDKQTHICICLPGYVGDGYTCYVKSQVTSMTEKSPSSSSSSSISPRCDNEGMCWCLPGYEFRDDNCYKSDKYQPDPTHSSNNDLVAQPLPECLKDNCICPWGYDYQQLDDSCVPKPGYNYETMGPSGSQLSCNVVNTCHPYAQCIFIKDTEEYECRCNPGYEGDGIECVKTDVSCLDIDICDPNASCRPDEPVAKCVCNPGYEGDGSTCTLIDECNDHSECDTDERCSYNPTKSRYECTCNPGFNMVNGRCVVADCSTNPSLCHANGQCINRDGDYKCVCINGFHGDGINQCTEDHIGCDVLNNCGNNAVCGYNQTSTNYACVCLPGYYGDGFNCIPQTSCRKEPSLCSRDATCVVVGGSDYACVCNEGFTGDGLNCKTKSKHESNFLLVNQGMATLKIPYYPTNVNPGTPINLDYAQMAIAIDIDCAGGNVYTSDITGNKITKLSYNGSHIEKFITGVSSPEGISIDWVSRNIFWTDSGKGTVEVAHLGTKKRKVIISDGLVNPRGIAVHPYRGKIFWSDWNRVMPKLEWANEDGTGRELFLNGDQVQLPNSLCIDWATDELCWTDAGTFTISCTPIDHKSVRIVAKDLSYPFGLAISEDNYYWTDWKTHKIEVISKTTGLNENSLSIPPGGSGKLYGIVAVPESCPRVSNVCQYENGRCHKDQLCLPDGQGGRTCACADDSTGPCTESRYPS
ncbi:nidogen-like isoform X1 [Microplitis mediator]|uniref:nidogen-like isoform X1 n=1 Tax=Microplitis mediator TaxID=375433 RepID=UPI002557BCE4|nr:nidogen-like isoform X1 [Microplitis mediator]